MPEPENLYRRSEKEDECFLITRYVSRRLAYPVARLFQRLGWSANAVTLLGGLAWMASIATILYAGLAWDCGEARAAWAALLITAALWNVGYILDVADGSLARLNGTSSLSGFYLDFYFHLLVIPMFLCSIGVFLFLAGGRLVYLPLAVLSVCCNWGVSFGAKEHVLCEEIAKGHCRPDSLPQEQRYRLFIDSPRTKAPAVTKTAPLVMARRLAEELVCFPGQFTLFGLAVVGDFALRRCVALDLPLLKFCFLSVTVVMLLRVPFRLRREFRTLRDFDAMNRDSRPR